MKCWSFRANVSGIRVSFFFLVLVLFSFPAQAEIVTQGIWFTDEARYKLSEKNQKELTESLRRLTGLQELRFTDEGRLVSGDFVPAVGGSMQARKILHWAMSSGQAFLIEDHSESTTVNFGQMDQGLIHEDAIDGTRLTIWRVRIDFQDFRQMQASREIRLSFDPGITMLHELLHGLGYKDADTDREIGHCEELVNQVRAELGLAVRDQYFGETFVLAARMISVRLQFRSREILAENPSEGRVRKHYLYFRLPQGYTSLQGAIDELHTEALLKPKIRKD